MCGIVGFINFETKYEQARKKWLAHALYVDELRGGDSTGLALLPKKPLNMTDPDPKMSVYKKALGAADFLQLSRVGTMLTDAQNARVAIGHNRYATQGDKANDNFAHPFCSEGVTMVHNGTLTTRNGLSMGHTVDSAAICLEMGITDSAEYGGLLEKLHGAYALVWHSQADNKVYIGRNEQRPLCFARAFEGKTLLYASEEWMLTYLMSRIDSTAIEISDEGYYDAWMIDKDKMYTFDLSAEDVDSSMSETSITPYTPPKTTYQNYSQGGNYHNKHNGGGNFPHQGAGTKKTGIITCDENKTQLTLSGPNCGCPLTKGDILYAEDWEYTTINDKGTKGTISGISVAYPDVTFSCPNVTSARFKKLSKEWGDWRDYLEDEDNEMHEGDVFITGKVTSTSRIKNQKKWVVNLAPKSMKLEMVETAFTDTKESDEEDTTEKKPKAPSKGATTTTREGYSSKQTQAIVKKILGDVKINPTVSTGKPSCGDIQKSKLFNRVFNVGGQLVNYMDWVGAVAGGCVWCLRAFTIAEADSITWQSHLVDGDTEILRPVCEDCAATIIDSNQQRKH